MHTPSFIRKIAPIGLWCAVSIFFATAEVSAIWPPSTSLEEETNQSTADGDSLPTTSERAREVVDRLEQDERKLANLLKDLEEQKRKLSATKSWVDGQEHENGHRVR